MVTANNASEPYLVHFVHGKETGPWGSKIMRLAEIAIAHGMQVESLDYMGIDSPQARADKLVRSCTGTGNTLVLVGSSMGGWVATRASMTLRPAGLFLMAPAFLLPGYPPVQPGCDPGTVEIVHGWRDDVILYEHSVRVGREFGCTVHLVDDDHRLQSPRRELDQYFSLFLQRVLSRTRPEPWRLCPQGLDQQKMDELNSPASRRRRGQSAE